MTANNILFGLGLLASILLTVAGIADQFTPPWNELASLGGAIGAGINGFLMTRPRKEWSDEKREQQTGVFKRPDPKE